MSYLDHIDLFSGIGGFSLAWRWCGGKTVQFVEIDPFCQKVLRKNFGKDIFVHDDIKTFKYSGASPFILTAGIPCQPASCAGKRRGTEDDRWLWDEAIKVIRHVKSRWIILENVLGLATLAEQYSDVKVENKTVVRLAGSDFYKGIFSRQEILQLGIIIQKVEDAGYELPQLKDGTPIILVVPACAVGAPHRRDRVWIVAHSGCLGQTKQEQQATRREQHNCHAADTKKFIAGGLQIREGTEHSGLAGTDWGEPWIEAATRLCRVDARIPNRVDRLKSLGNAIVPQVAFQIMKAILEAENNALPLKALSGTGGTR